MKKKYKVYDTRTFIEVAVEKHGDKYDYSETVYTTTRNKVKIKCKKHDIYFLQNAANHLFKHGCPDCGDETISIKRLKTIDYFIKNSQEKHGIDTFSYDKAIYTNAKTPVKIYCNKGKHYFEQIPHDHYKARGCPKCLRPISTTEDFITAAKTKYRKQI
mgnify:FL=1